MRSCPIFPTLHSLPINMKHFLTFLKTKFYLDIQIYGFIFESPFGTFLMFCLNDAYFCIYTFVGDLSCESFFSTISFSQLYNLQLFGFIFSLVMVHWIILILCVLLSYNLLLSLVVITNFQNWKDKINSIYFGISMA